MDRGPVTRPRLQKYPSRRPDGSLRQWTIEVYFQSRGGTTGGFALRHGPTAASARRRLHDVVRGPSVYRSTDAVRAGSSRMSLFQGIRPIQRLVPTRTCKSGLGSQNNPALGVSPVAKSGALVITSWDRSSILVIPYEEGEGGVVTGLLRQETCIPDARPYSDQGSHPAVAVRPLIRNAAERH